MKKLDMDRSNVGQNAQLIFVQQAIHMDSCHELPQ